MAITTQPGRAEIETYEPFVLQVHHADHDKKIEVMLCANCHDTVRRGTFEDLRKAHEGDDESIILTRHFI